MPIGESGEGYLLKVSLAAPLILYQRWREFGTPSSQAKYKMQVLDGTYLSVRRIHSRSNHVFRHAVFRRRTIRSRHS